MQIKKVFIFLSIFLSFQTSVADEPNPLVFFACDTNQGLFSLTSALEYNTNYEDGQYFTVIPLDGHQKLNSDTSLNCIIGNRVIAADIEVSPPSSGTAMCRGLTRYYVRSFQIDGVPVIDRYPFSFNIDCADSSIMDIQIKVSENEAFITVCSSDNTSSRRYSDLDCETFSK